MRDIKTNNTTETLPEENKRLRRELKLAIQERGILKKATASTGISFMARTL